MIKILLIVLFTSTQLIYNVAFSGDTKVLESSIGKLLIFHDQKFSYQNDLNPFGSAIMYDEFVATYKDNIKGLKLEERVNFFWFAMWHLDFDGHSMEQFQMLITNDCGDNFIERLEQYVKKESELKRNKTRLYLSKKVLSGLKLNQKSKGGAAE